MVSRDLDLTVVRSALGSAVVSDVLDGLGHRHQCLATGLSPLLPDQVIVGYAFTVQVQRVSEIPVDAFSGLVRALDRLRPDDVFVAPTGRAPDIAVWGELLSTAARARGAAGAVTDGMVRDSRAIRQLGFPVISAGTIPYDSMGRSEIVADGVPVAIDGVAIRAGDLIVGDSDGVVVVPAGIAATVIGRAANKRAQEEQFRDSVAQGMPATEAFTTYGVL